jgi:catechol 2,3-dioxygenase-like lactoylglutathione lyase family enzyme
MVELRALTAIDRGVPDPQGTAEFFSWLLNTPWEADGEGASVACDNGVLRLRQAGAAVRITWQADVSAETCDPDGVPLGTAVTGDSQPGSVRLDHVRLNCADLATTVRFYQRHGLRPTWVGGRNAVRLNMDGEELPAGAEWVHLSATRGYVSLSQADWKDYGIHNTATGPPRFMHVGLAVPDVQDVVERLRSAGTPHLDVETDIGRQVYVNDPSGDPARGNNIELVEYRPGVVVSGNGSQWS